MNTSRGFIGLAVLILIVVGVAIIGAGAYSMNKSWPADVDGTPTPVSAEDDTGFNTASTGTSVLEVVVKKVYTKDNTIYVDVSPIPQFGYFRPLGCDSSDEAYIDEKDSSGKVIPGVRLVCVKEQGVYEIQGELPMQTYALASDAAIKLLKSGDGQELRPTLSPSQFLAEHAVNAFVANGIFSIEFAGGVVSSVTQNWVP